MDSPDDIRGKVASILRHASPLTPPKNNNKARFLSVMIALIAIIVISAFSAYSYYNRPRGEITAPAAGSKTGRLVQIEGYTRNIPPGQRHLWLVVEVKGLNLCWPKRLIYRPNEPFKTTIHENGPNQEYTVALYALDQINQLEIQKWFEINRNSKRESGLEMLPNQFKLDDVKLILKN